MKTLIRLLVSVIVLFIFLIVAFFIFFSRIGKAAQNYVGDFKPDVKKLADGKYIGSFMYINERISSEVTFEIKDSSLWLINFDKLYGSPVLGAQQKVIDRIDSLKNLDFDAVSGATVTSMFAKAAIKNAIENGPQ